MSPNNVQKHQRLDTSGLFYPGCDKCSHVYVHADNCEYIQTEFTVKIYDKIRKK